eukprot:2170996-Rhodomonas_salina.4
MQYLLPPWDVGHAPVHRARSLRAAFRVSELRFTELGAAVSGVAAVWQQRCECCCQDVGAAHDGISTAVQSVSAAVEGAGQCFLVWASVVWSEPAHLSQSAFCYPESEPGIYATQCEQDLCS